jgi:hypothetical protein
VQSSGRVLAFFCASKMNQQQANLTSFADGCKAEPELTPQLGQHERMPDDLAALRRANRWHDVVRMLIERARGSGDTAARVQDWNEAGVVFLERFDNQFEAMRCFEASLVLDPNQPAISAKLHDLHELRRP